MAQDERQNSLHDSPDEAYPDESVDETEERQPLARVRYAFGKELQLFPDSFVLLRREEAEADRVELTNIKRLILTPGEPNPSKLMLMFELDDGNTIIAAEGVSAVKEFRALLTTLNEIAPQIELDPPDMGDQLKQALDIRRRSLLGCYGSIIGSCILLWLIYLAVAFFGAHAGH